MVDESFKFLLDFFQESEFVDTNLGGAASSPPEDIFGILEALEFDHPPEEITTSTAAPKEVEEIPRLLLVSQKSTSSCSTQLQESEPELEAAASPKSKRQKLTHVVDDGQQQQQQPSHITVERNRRKQMNEHLSVLRSLMPSFYVKRGDQASIVGGVVEYINELQQVLQSLEAKKQRKVYSEVLSPRTCSLPHSPRKPPISPRPSLPISPTTPQPITSPYNRRTLHHLGYNLSATNLATSSLDPSPSNSSSSSSIDYSNAANELVANSKSAVANVEVKFTGPNVVLKTISPKITGQPVKIISAIEDLSLEILDVSINTVSETMLNSFTIKIGIECKLSAEELAQQIQQTFC